MPNSVKILSLLLSATLGFSAMAQAQSNGLTVEAFQNLYKNSLAKMASATSAQDKATYLHNLDDNYEKRVNELRASGRVGTPEYNAAWDTYKFIIPLLKLKAGANGQFFTMKSCLEAQSLVDFITTDTQGEDAKVIHAAARAELLSALKIACAQ